MTQITSFNFDKNYFTKLIDFPYGTNWPVVYVLEDGKEIYIGETVDVHSRSKQHFENPERRKLKNLHVISDEEFNKSATLDIESLLIQYIASEGSYLIQNGNQGLSNHDYYDRQKYLAKFEIL